MRRTTVLSIFVAFVLAGCGDPLRGYATNNDDATRNAVPADPRINRVSETTPDASVDSSDIWSLEAGLKMPPILLR